VFFFVAVRKGDKFNDNEWISLLNNFLQFLGVKTKWHEDKIRLPAEPLADAKNARSENRVFYRLCTKKFFGVSAFLKRFMGGPCCGTCSWAPHCACCCVIQVGFESKS